MKPWKLCFPSKDATADVVLARLTPLAIRIIDVSSEEMAAEDVVVR